MARNQVGKGKISLKMLDSNNENYTENLGYATVDIWNDSDSQTAVAISAYQQGLYNVSQLMDSTYVGNRFSYEFEVSD